MTLIGGFCVLMGFAAIELRTTRRGGQPLVDLRLFTNRGFLGSNIANALIMLSFFGSIILVPIYLQELRGLRAFQSGLFVLPFAIAATLDALAGGRLVDRFGSRIVLLPGLALLIISTWQMARLQLSTPYTWALLAPASLAG